MASSMNNKEVNQQNGESFGGTNLIINYLPQSFTQTELRSLFSNIGVVKECNIIKDRITKRHLGYGFVKFYNSKDAATAINTLNGLKIQNKTIKVSYARPSSEEIKGANLYVSNLPKSITLQDLETLFSPYGQIVTKRILHDKIAASQLKNLDEDIPVLSKGVAFIRYDKRSYAMHAVHELNGVIPQGYTEPISVRFANKQENERTTQTTRCTEFIHHQNCFFYQSETMHVNNVQSMMQVNNTPNTPIVPEWCIFIYNLAPDTREFDLWQLFAPFGIIIRVALIRNTLGRNGYGFVTMDNFNSAVIAIHSLNGYTFRNCVLQVSFKDGKGRLRNGSI